MSHRHVKFLELCIGAAATEACRARERVSGEDRCAFGPVCVPDGLSGAAGRDEREAGRHDSCGRGRGCGSPGGYFLGTACLWPGVVEGVSMVTTPVGPRGGGIKGGTEAPVGSEAVRSVAARGKKGRVRSGGIHQEQQHRFHGPNRF